MVKIKFIPDFELDEDSEEIVFDVEDEFDNLQPLSLEEALSRTLCFTNPKKDCKCKASLQCEGYKKYRKASLSALMVILTADPKMTITPVIDKKDLN